MILSLSQVCRQGLVGKLPLFDSWEHQTPICCVQGDGRGYDWLPPRGRDLRTGWDASWRGGRLPPPPQRHLSGRDAQDSPPHMRGPAGGAREVTIPTSSGQIAAKQTLLALAGSRIADVINGALTLALSSAVWSSEDSGACTPCLGKQGTMAAQWLPRDT